MKAMIRKAIAGLLLALLFGLFMTACGGGGGGDGGTAAPQGTLSTALTDATTDEYRAVYVTIARVDVHHDNDGTWETVATPAPQKTFNLLELVNGVRETLGVATLDTGRYTQMRLIIGTTPDTGLNISSQRHPYANYIIDRDDGEVHELKVPSGTNTGIKVVNGFDINENRTTELILDFDAMLSVVKAGASGQYLLKPTVKVLNTADYAIVAGQVTDVPPATIPPTPATGLEGALVSAQQADPLATDIKDQVTIEAATVTAPDGAYQLFLEPQSYNLVAYRDGYLPACSAVTLTANDRPLADPVDFALAEAVAFGTVAGNVIIDTLPANQWAVIDFRQTLTCSSGTAMVTVKSLNVADGGNYAVTLPTGSYMVVASTFGRATEAANVIVLAGATTVQNIVLDVVTAP